MIDLRSAPHAITKQQRRLLVAVTAIAAATRFLALARSPWDWDEMLFLLGLRDYDVASHHPHPPGFPLYMLLSRSLVAAGLDPFRSLQTINLAAAICAVPAIVFLCRELRFRFETSVGAAVLFAFLPNVWFFGGTAFSDVSAIVLTVVACALLLRGARSSHALVAGAVVLAIAAGFRPQNLLVGAAPALIASAMQIRQKRYGVVLAAVGTGALIVFVSYAGAIAATGDWHRYRDALMAHQQYLSDVDSFRSPTRPSLLKVFDDFFIRPFRFGAVNVIISLLAAISLGAALARRHGPVLLATLMFGPFWVLAWLTLDFHSVSRFSIGYMPLLVILCADGMAVATRRRGVVFAACVVGLTAVMAVWAWPAMSRVRTAVSPPAQAVRALAGSASTVYVQKRLRPYAEYYLADHHLVHVEEQAPADASGLFLREGTSAIEGATTFSWPRGRLWNIVRRRYFAVSIEPLTPLVDSRLPTAGTGSSARPRS